MSAQAPRTAARGPNQDRICLVAMPWRSARSPSLALGLIKALLSRAGLASDILEAGLLQQRLTRPALFAALGAQIEGELAFAPYAYDDVGPDDARDRLRRGLAGSFPAGGDVDPGEAVDAAGALLDRLIADVDFGRYRAVGFTLTYQQTLASVALARRIKQRHPSTRIVIGGACCEGPMGEALLEQFDCFDYAVSGRAEQNATAVFEAALGRREPDGTPGLYYRAPHGGVRGQPPVASQVALDTLPTPDFDDYFGLLDQLGLPRAEVHLLMETSNGCWWGEKHLCTFCGLNATQLAYRQKSGQRVLAEMNELSQRYEIDEFELVDNILPMSAFKDLLPALAEQTYTYTLFADVKTNLRKEQIELLAQAGFNCLQPGVESFNDHILQVMDKGCTGIGQVEFVKWCTELGIELAYGVLVRNPGEHAEDYERMASWIPSLIHLKPPQVDPFPIQICRFSPYFDHPERWNIRDVRPMPIYREIFRGAPSERLQRLAYTFDYRCDALDEPGLRAARDAFVEAVQRWRRVHRMGCLVYRKGDGWLRITDVRRGLWVGDVSKVQHIVLRGAQAALYAACERARTPASLATEFPQIPPDKLRSFLDEMVRRRLMLDDGRKVLSLAVDAFATIPTIPPDAYDAELDDAPPPQGWAATVKEFAGVQSRRAQRLRVL